MPYCRDSKNNYSGIFIRPYKKAHSQMFRFANFLFQQFISDIKAQNIPKLDIIFLHRFGYQDNDSCFPSFHLPSKQNFPLCQLFQHMIFVFEFPKYSISQTFRLAFGQIKFLLNCLNMILEFLLNRQVEQVLTYVGLAGNFGRQEYQMSMSVDDFGLSQIVFFVINHSILARLLDHINLLLVVNQSGVTVLFPTGVDDFDVFPLIDHRFLEQLPFAVSNFHCVFEEEGAYLFRCFELHLSDFVGGVEESVVVGFVLPAFDISRVQILMPVIVTLHNTRNGCHALTEPNQSRTIIYTKSLKGANVRGGTGCRKTGKLISLITHEYNNKIVQQCDAIM